MATHWGVAGCGFISTEFVTSWRALPKSDHVLVAAAARSRDNAQKFVQKFGGGRAYGSYQELANDSKVEVVYIGTINTTHLEIVTMMLEAGKHVLCEKPLGLNVQETKTMVDMARKKGLFFMEAIWSRCFPVYKEITRRMDAGEIGQVEFVAVSFGLLIETDRMRKRALGGGSTLDLGVYCIQFVLHAFDGQVPNKIVATGILNEEGVDESVSVALTFPSGGMANLSYSCRANLDNVGVISGSKGTIRIEPTWCPEKLTSPSGEFVSLLPSIEGSTFRFPNSQGLMYEADEVRNCLRNGLKECPLVPHDLTLKIAQIIQTIHQQLGIVY